jgi:hypothetical protein
MVSMFKNARTLVCHACCAIAATLAIPGGAIAGFVNDQPDPFLGHSVQLQRPTGALVPLPGLGPGGGTLYARAFNIDNFRLTSPGAGVSAGSWDYLADFSADFLDASGVPVGATLDIADGSFQVNWSPARAPSDLGTFDMTIASVVFNGTLGGDTIEVALAAASLNRVSISDLGTGSYLIEYLPPAPSQPAIPNKDAYYIYQGTRHDVTDLVDANAPLPATAVLLMPGLLGLVALRRRLEAVPRPL